MPLGHSHFGGVPTGTMPPVQRSGCSIAVHWRRRGSKRVPSGHSHFGGVPTGTIPPVQRSGCSIAVH
jgi:hypothetical protein